MDEESEEEEDDDDDDVFLKLIDSVRESPYEEVTYVDWNHASNVCSSSRQTDIEEALRGKGSHLSYLSNSDCELSAAEHKILDDIIFTGCRLCHRAPEPEQSNANSRFVDVF